jgi:hypothetical protein
MTAGISFLGLLATAALASAQVNVTSPPAGTAGPTNVQAGPVQVQTTPGGGTSVNLGQGPGSAAANQMRDDAAARQENRMERRDQRQMDRNSGARDWRMVRQNNQWWYWHPNNTWSVYRNNHWTPYTANNSTFAPNTAASQPATQYYTRRGPLGMRRQVTGYRGVTTPPPATSTSEAPPAVPTAPTTGTDTTSGTGTTTGTGAANPQGGQNGQPNDPMIKGVK